MSCVLVIDARGGKEFRARVQQARGGKDTHDARLCVHVEGSGLKMSVRKHAASLAALMLYSILFYSILDLEREEA